METGHRIEDGRWRRLRDDIPSWVDGRLLEWVKWTRTNGNTLGWPPRTLLARIIEEGWHGASQPGQRPTDEIPADVMEVDQIVARMMPRLRRVLKAYYLSGLPVSVKARALRLSEKTFRVRLEAARFYVLAALEHRGFKVP